MYDHLLVPLDRSARAEVAIAAARQIAEASNARLTLLTVTEPLPAGVSSAAREDSWRDSERYLDDEARSLPAHTYAVDLYVASGEPARAILNYAAAHHVDLIVMAGHGATDERRMPLGSVTRQVLERGEVPVLVVRSVPRRDQLAAVAAAQAAEPHLEESADASASLGLLVSPCVSKTGAPDREEGTMRLAAFVLIETEGGTVRSVARACKALDLPEVDVTRVSVVTGPYSVIVRVEADDVNILGRLTDTLHSIPGVQHTVTCIELEEAASPVRPAAAHADRVTHPPIFGNTETPAEMLARFKRLSGSPDTLELASTFSEVRTRA